MKTGMKNGNVTTSNNGMEYGNVIIGIEYWLYLRMDRVHRRLLNKNTIISTLCQYVHYNNS